MYSIFTTAILLSALFTTSLAESNITVADTDPLIKYEGSAGHASLCQYDANDHLVAGQPGCYNLPSKCTSSVAMGQSKADAASFKFKGSAIYINSLLFDISPLYSITLDGKSVEVDGFRPTGLFSCNTLFSQAGLDPNVEHEIRLSIKDLSPSRNQTKGPSHDAFVFSLINFIYTAADNSSFFPSPSPKSSGSSNNIGVPGLTTLLSLGLFAFHSKSSQWI